MGHSIVSMQRKLFPFDKNHILKEAQLGCKEGLLKVLVENAKQSYLDLCNPLGLEDDPIRKIKSSRHFELNLLEEFYEHLAGIYRYKYGSNQLEFRFDGKSHYEKYREDWSETFHEWTAEFCRDVNFLKAILEVTVFYPKDRKALLAGNRLKTYISQQFYLKVYRYRGIVRLNAASK